MVQAILLDIEGTVAPIDFVYSVLFPYARDHLRTFLENNLHSPGLENILGLLVEECNTDRRNGLNPPLLKGEHGGFEVIRLSEYVLWLMDQDRKAAGLKALQGLIWEQGFFAGELNAPLFRDVLPAFSGWVNRGLKIYIFSSGSVLAQRLFFAHTDQGDLGWLISGYFDTSTGPKTSPASYRLIADSIGIAPTRVLFISDVVEELNAATNAGMKTALAIRPGNLPQSGTNKHKSISTLEDLPCNPAIDDSETLSEP